MKQFLVLMAGGLTVITVLMAVQILRLPHGELVVDFLDVGQGDAILLTTPDQHHILVDGGPGQTVLQELGAVLPFLQRRLDLVVLTHPDADHVTGLIPVLERYEVGAVLFPGTNKNTLLYSAFLERLNERGIPFYVAQAGEDFRLGEVELDVLYPLESLLGATVENVNNEGVVMTVHYRGERLLLTGDIEEETEEKLLESGLDLRADVLKVGHHGSRTSSTLSFLEAVRPATAVIQLGANNDYGHPHPETLQKLWRMNVEVHRTDLEGRVRLRFNGP